MVFKRYIKRGGKIYGPYYYESYRDKNRVVRKKYIGTSDPKTKKIVVRRRVISLFNKRNLIVFGGVLLIFAFIFITLYSYETGISGRVVSGVTYVSKPVLVPVSKITGFVVSEEEVIEQFDKTIDLEIKEPLNLVSQPLTENKNKIMEFEGGLRLYFSLLNYTEFAENINEKYIKEKESKLKGEEKNKGKAEETDENSDDNKNKGKKSGQSGNESEEQDGEEIKTDFEQQETGYGITAFFIKLFNNFLSLTGKAIEPIQTGYGEINFGEVKQIAENLTSEELDEVSKQASLNLDEDEFDIEVNETKAKESGVDYKWGYRVKLNDLKFMAKVDITSNEEINLLDKSSLKIGNKILLFKDLTDSGYDVRIDKPSLKIDNATSRLTENVTEVIEEFNETEVYESNATSNVSIIEKNVTGAVPNITEESEVGSNITVEEKINKTKERDEEKKDKDKNNTIEKDFINKSEEKEEKGEKKLEEEMGQEDEEPKEKSDKDKSKKQQKKSGIIEQEESEETQTGYGLDKQTGYGIIGNVIRAITGFVVESISPEIADIKYNYTVSVYIERDFREMNSTLLKSNDIDNLLQDEESSSSGESFLAGDESQSESGLENNLNDEKNNEGSNGMEPNQSIPDYNYNEEKYLNISVDSDESHARVVEWLSQPIDTRRPSGHVGSIPAPSVTISDNTTQNESTTSESNINIDNLLQDEESIPSSGRSGSLSESGDGLLDLGDTNINKNGEGDLSESEHLMIPGIDYQDLDEDGKVSIGDIIFLDPSLIIIKIIKAEHLDENRSFISDIYNETREKDDVWSEIINESEYVRVTFEKNLTKNNDITVYARAISKCDLGESFIIINEAEVSCEIYQKKKRIDEINEMLG